MAIRKRKKNIDTEERSDFDNMMNDVENEVEEQQAEDGLVNRVSELKQLSEDIDKATNTFINAALELESAIQQYPRHRHMTQTWKWLRQCTLQTTVSLHERHYLLSLYHYPLESEPH